MGLTIAMPYWRDYLTRGCLTAGFECMFKIFQTMGSTIFKNLTKVNLVASYSVSTIKNKDFEEDIIYYL